MVTERRAPAVSRAFAILGCIRREGPCTLARIAARTELPRSTVVDLIDTLSDDLLLERSEDGQYRVGRLSARLVAGFTGGVPILESFLELCERVDELSGYTVALDTLDCGESLCLSVRHGRLPLPLTPRVGRRQPLASTPGGLVIARGMTAQMWAQHVAAFRGLIAQTSLPDSEGPDGPVERHDPRKGRLIALAVPLPNTTPVAVTVVLPPSRDDVDTARLHRGLTRLALLLSREASIEQEAPSAQ
ncbi:MAG: helix-turn-helix domain-containing protein [Microbacterium sp.]